MNYTNFSILLGIYDTDFSVTKQCEELTINFPLGTTTKGIKLLAKADKGVLSHSTSP